MEAAERWLLAGGIRADTDWLAGCIEYLRSDDSHNYTQAEINNLAKEQWLLNDLKDVCPGSLPADLNNKAKTIVNGTFALQVNCSLDVGTPAYQQYQKLKKINLENIEETMRQDEKISSHRMIRLSLTDGVQNVYGIEYKPIRILSCDIMPGCKILLKGPIVCRRGVFLLEERHIELLGGEVEDLVASNNLNTLLSRILGVQEMTARTHSGHTGDNTALALLPEPIRIQHTATLNRPTNITSNRPTATNIYDSEPQQASSYNDHRQISERPVIGNIGRPVARVTGIPVTDIFNDEDIDLDQLSAIEEQATKQTNKRMLCDNGRNNPEKKLKQNQTPANRIEDFPTEEDLFEDIFQEMELECHNTPSVSSNSVEYPIIVPSEPFVYIKQIKDMDEIDRIGKIFRIKAQILKLLSKLSIGKEGWSLKCTLIDGTSCLDVEFTNNVLTKLVGYSPSQMSEIKKQIASKPELKENAMLALRAAKQALQVLNCIIEITMLDMPKITELTPFTDTHAKLLSDRVIVAETNC